MEGGIDGIKWLSSLAKVFPEKEPEEDFNGYGHSFFTNEVYSFQCAYFVQGRDNGMIRIKAGGKLARFAAIRQVCLMPARFAGRKDCDDHYLSTEPGLYPDLLRELKDGQVRLHAQQWQALFITIDLEGAKEWEIPYGEQEFTIAFQDEETKLGEISTVLCVRNEMLPKQKLYHTEWFHADCLADYYKVKVWSEEHWEILEHFLSHYAKTGMNTIIVPTFTPPLDTAVGHERTTVQLLDVTCKNGRYDFQFERLHRFIELCKEVGICYFEIAHLFTQWGAKAAPKIMAFKDGSLQKIFGWETDAKSQEYQDFLKQYLTALVVKLDEWELRGKVFFHLSDEPEEQNREDYGALRKRVSAFLGEYPVLDALSRYSFYEQGIVDRPVPGIDHLDKFLECKVPHLWTYHCCAQEKDVPNRFFSMPSARNRILGLLLYYYEIEGLLHWGYNFYNSQFSLESINPYEVTDAGGAFQAGDSFLVYPGKDGYPEDSLRMMVLAEAMQDIRAFQALEALTSREEVLRIIETWVTYQPTMTAYPLDHATILGLREDVNERIARYKG